MILVKPADVYFLWQQIQTVNKTLICDNYRTICNNVIHLSTNNHNLSALFVDCTSRCSFISSSITKIDGNHLFLGGFCSNFKSIVSQWAVSFVLDPHLCLLQMIHDSSFEVIKGDLNHVLHVVKGSLLKQTRILSRP